MVSADPSAVGDLQGFFHIRILIGLVTGLSVTRILTGLARFVQHPDQNQVYLPHFTWAAFLLLYVFHFWWAEFGLLAVHRWQFQDFLFIIFYAALIFVTAALLFPDTLAGYASYRAYFTSRHTWFYGLLLAILVVDLADTLFKGWPHVEALGWRYGVRQVVLMGLAIAGLLVRAHRPHLIFAGAAICAELWWVFARYRFLD